MDLTDLDLPVSFRMDLHLKLLGSWFRDLGLESIPFVEAHRPLNGDRGLLSDPSMLEARAIVWVFSLLLSDEASLGVSHVRV